MVLSSDTTCPPKVSEVLDYLPAFGGHRELQKAAVSPSMTLVTLVVMPGSPITRVTLVTEGSLSTTPVSSVTTGSPCTTTTRVSVGCVSMT